VGPPPTAVPPYDPTVVLCLRPYAGPGGGGCFLCVRYPCKGCIRKHGHLLVACIETINRRSSYWSLRPWPAHSGSRQSHSPPGQGPTVVLVGSAVFYERGTPVLESRPPPTGVRALGPLGQKPPGNLKTCLRLQASGFRVLPIPKPSTPNLFSTSPSNPTKSLSPELRGNRKHLTY